MTEPAHHAFLLSETAREDLLKKDRGVFVPEPSELYREVGGNWHMVEMDYPAICYEGRADSRLHVTGAVLNLLSEEDIESFMLGLKNKFSAVLLMDETRHSLFLKAELESNSLAAVGRQLHLGSLVVHYKRVTHGFRRKT